MQCLDANEVQELLSGSLPGPRKALVIEHLDTCDDCRSLVAVFARGLAPTDPGAAGVAGPGFEQTAVAMSEVAAPPPRKARTPATLPAGTAVGRYVVAELLGAGGMGVVYRCDDRELGRKVAVKLLRRDLREAIGEARLLREAQAMARISHPNVVSVHDVGTHDDQVFVAMELIDGESLRTWLRARPRSVGEIVQVFAAAGRGLAAAHAAGLVHRDFKPDNVLVGRDGRVGVTDFGLARALAAAPEPTRPGEPTPALEEPLTVSGAVIGTPAYMAPEQHEGANVDARSDQFAFCVALYEALYGERPFGGKTYAELALEVAAGRVRPAPASRRGRVPAGLRAIVLRGLRVRPGDRFATMDELLEALGRDRTRVPRTLGWAMLALAAIAACGLFADWLVRDRAVAAARIWFRAARDQFVRAEALRDRAFVAAADQSYVVDAMRSVSGNRDQADFGLGDPADDQQALKDLHDVLHDASFVQWAKMESRGVVAVADYKGRLLYTSAAPTRWGADATVLPAVKRAYAAGDAAQVMRGDDPALRASGVLGDAPRDGVAVVFAHTIKIGDAASAVFVQLVDGQRLLDDVSVGEATQLALVAPDGARTGAVPPPVIAAALATGGDDALVAIDGTSWLVESTPMAGLGGGDVIAHVVLAQPLDVGLAGLFVGARTVLGAATLLLLVGALAAALTARRASALAS